jgi:hypothetical protein
MVKNIKKRNQKVDKIGPKQYWNKSAKYLRLRPQRNYKNIQKCGKFTI